jgi:Fe-Mn family superoxide dismutase
MAFRLPPLPYAYDALEPAIAAWAVKRHYEDNHAGYYRKVNELLGGKTDNRSMLQIALSTEPYTPLNNAAAQGWAHDFWWDSMTPDPMPLPSWVHKKSFEETWINKGVALFGSGWLWLVLKQDGKLDIIALPDAQLPQHSRMKPILVMDLWEHAYYCQYGTKRADYLRQTLSLLNWEIAEQRLQR